MVLFMSEDKAGDKSLGMVGSDGFQAMELMTLREENTAGEKGSQDGAPRRSWLRSSRREVSKEEGLASQARRKGGQCYPLAKEKNMFQERKTQ